MDRVRAINLPGRSSTAPLVNEMTKMKNIIYSLILIFFSALRVFASEQGPDMKPWKTEVSPSKKIIVSYYRSDNQEGNQIWLMTGGDKHKKSKLLYEFNRDAEVIFSPDEKWLLINDRAGSNIFEVLLLKRHGAADYREVKDAEVTGKAWALFTRENALPKKTSLFHSYIEGIRWSADSKAFLLVLWGHTDENHYLDEWFCVYDLNKFQPSMNLEFMNRNTVHIKTR